MSGRSRTDLEDGVSLVEVLVALAIIGIAVTSIVGGLGTASIASDTHRKEVNTDTVVRSYAEVIKEQVHLNGYVPCATVTSYPIPRDVWEPPAGYVTSFDLIQFWHALPAPGGFTDPPCATDEGAQLISVSARSVDGRDTESLQVIVRTP
jgi:prepilin-type N-terminal cleavage/methylation domain-containing protein